MATVWMQAVRDDPESTYFCNHKNYIASSGFPLLWTLTSLTVRWLSHTLTCCCVITKSVLLTWQSKLQLLHVFLIISSHQLRRKIHWMHWSHCVAYNISFRLTVGELNMQYLHHSWQSDHSPLWQNFVYKLWLRQTCETLFQSCHSWVLFFLFVHLVQPPWNVHFQWWPECAQDFGSV